jgi:protein CpxP
MGTKKFLGGLALAAGFALTSGVAVAQQQQQSPAQGQDGRGRAERPWGPEGGKGRRGGRFGGGHFGGGAFRGLDLTDAQREQLRQIAKRYRATFEARHARGDRRPASDPLAGGAFDEAAVRAAAQARAAAQVEREVAHARMMHEMYNVLTPAQKEQLAAARQERQQRRQEFRTRRGAPQTQLQ